MLLLYKQFYQFSMLFVSRRWPIWRISGSINIDLVIIIFSLYRYAQLPTRKFETLVAKFVGYIIYFNLRRKARFGITISKKFVAYCSPLFTWNFNVQREKINIPIRESNFVFWNIMNGYQREQWLISISINNRQLKLNENESVKWKNCFF